LLQLVSLSLLNNNYTYIWFNPLYILLYSMVRTDKVTHSMLIAFPYLDYHVEGWIRKDTCCLRKCAMGFYHIVLRVLSKLNICSFASTFLAPYFHWIKLLQVLWCWFNLKIKNAETASFNGAIWDEFSEQHKHQTIFNPRLALFNLNKVQI
jgi:hypothetical protein